MSFASKDSSGRVVQSLLPVDHIALEWMVAEPCSLGVEPRVAVVDAPTVGLAFRDTLPVAALVGDTVAAVGAHHLG